MRTRILALSMLLLGCSGNPSYETVMPTLKAELSAAKFDILTNNVTITEQIEKECVRSTKSKADKIAGEFLGTDDQGGEAYLQVNLRTTRSMDDIARHFAKDVKRLGYVLREKTPVLANEWLQRAARTDANGRETVIMGSVSSHGSHFKIYIPCDQLRK